MVGSVPIGVSDNRVKYRRDWGHQTQKKVRRIKKSSDFETKMGRILRSTGISAFAESYRSAAFAASGDV